MKAWRVHELGAPADVLRLEEVPDPVAGDVRAAGGPCTRCGAELERATVGGRTTIWCPGHQR